jgi:hypothetical protein
LGVARRAVFAQTTVRVRGTIEKVDGGALRLVVALADLGTGM